MTDKAYFDGCSWSHASGIGPQIAGATQPRLGDQMVPAHECLCMKCHTTVGQKRDSLVPDQVLWQCDSLVK